MSALEAIKERRVEETRVTVAVGAALVIQTAAALLWAGAAAERLSQLEERAGASSEIIERTARLEEQMAGARAALARIEAKLDRQQKDEL
jgi:hypothetical protein